MRQQLIQIACSILASAALAMPAFPQSETASVSGIVRDRRGAPQIDALIQLMRPDSSVVAIAHTDARGVFLLEDLLPGVYQIKASDESFLPSLRQNLRVPAHRKTVANMTLSTLLDAVQWLPAERRSATEPDDEWKWTLRSETNRPVLRFSDEGPMMVSEGSGPRQSRARVTTSGGMRDFGDGGLRHGMEYEGTGARGEHTLLRTSLNLTDGLQAGYMAAYENEIAPGRVVRTVAAYTDMPDLTGGPYGSGRFQSATLRTAETTELTPILRTELGNELLAMRLVGAQGGTEVVSRPFGSLVIHAGDTALEYRVATSRSAQDASALADDETLLPAVAQREGIATLEHGLHQEIRFRHKSEHGATVQIAAFHDRLVHPLVQGSGYISDADALSGDLLIDPVSGVFRTAGNTYAGYGFSAAATVQIAAFHDRLVHPLVQGSGYISDADALSGDLLIDPVSGVFRTAGNTYAGYGFSAAATVPLSPALAISAALEAGSALEDSYAQSALAGQERSVEQSLAALHPRLTPAVTVAAQGSLEKTGTYWRTSYRWQAPDTVTSVNPYASQAGDAYLSILLRQPIRIGRIFPGGTRAVVDMRNLLAQGYCPFVTPDGSTLFFAQADRSIAGGIAFTF